jgi:hypothetical protein
MKYCLFCEEEISHYQNGNRQYCDDDCYYSAKLYRQKEHRRDIAELRNRKCEAEYILHLLCQKHGILKPFNPMEAEDRGFDFGVADGIVNHEGKRGVRIGRFAYMLLNLNQMIIWTL